MTMIGALVDAQCREAGWPLPEREYPVCSSRKFRWDFAFPSQRLALEIDGGVWVKGGHSTGTGILRDMEKLNTGTVNGWRLLRLTPQQVKAGELTGWLKQMPLRDS